MKFAHEFREALRKEGYPQRWVDSAIPYAQLKKCLRKVRRELAGLGLDPEIIRQLLAAHAVSSQGDSVPVAQYNLNVQSRLLRPRLTVIVRLDEGGAVDASLSPSSRAFLQRLAASELGATDHALSAFQPAEDTAPGRPVRRPSELSVRDAASAGDDLPSFGRVEVPLTFDSEFFGLLHNDVATLDVLQGQEQESMKSEIISLGKEIALVTKPSRFSKTDLPAWRELFELYLESQVFFSTHERDHGARTSATAVKRLVWFQEQAQARELPSKLRLPGSRAAYTRFLALNAALLQSLKFQEINQIAVAKILKKFDKRTSLGVSTAFPAAFKSDRFLAENVAKDACALVSQEVVSVVPRLEDYICPVCLSIAWLPVRLTCRHVFCVRCVIKMQREQKRFCPLCRGDVVMAADFSNLDEDLEKFLKRYFREETKEKQKANEIERGIEIFGESYKYSSCTVM